MEYIYQMGQVDLQNAYGSCVTMCHFMWFILTQVATQDKKSPLVVSDSRMYTIKAIFKSQSILCRGICREGS